MPQFMTISPTHVSGKKQYAWEKFRDGGYIAIGWKREDFTGKNFDDIENILRAENYGNEASAISSFRKFLSLKTNEDIVAVNNVNHGLFGIGKVVSDYKYQLYKHDTASDDKDEHYSHYREVEWITTEYIPRTSILTKDEKGWSPYGTIGTFVSELPPYIGRIIGYEENDTPAELRECPDIGFLKPVIDSINILKEDPNHQERAHESLVEQFLVAIGYRMHKDIKFRQGRVDIAIGINTLSSTVIEVKRDWNLNLVSSIDAIKQAYNYALDLGRRFVIITNGDYYALFDRLKGLSISSNVIGEFQLSNLNDADLELVNKLKKENFCDIDVSELFTLLSENFKLDV